ncbi:TRAP transporter small permease subunit [Marinobacter sp.]|uniref:TRAP transporter small permease subunit n=1 Tax=Marinobacter sp. TaxID=50741 RepID=UPI003A8D393A
MNADIKAVPLCDRIDSVLYRIGYVMGWSYVLLVLVIILQITLRKGFSGGSIALEELQWHLYAVAMMFGLTAAQVKDSHVRVDLFYSRFSPHTRYLIEVIGICVLLMPFLVVVFLNSLDYVWESWRVGERSDASAGLPYRWLIKAVIPASFGLLILAALSRLVRDFVLLTSRGVSDGR